MAKRFTETDKWKDDWYLSLGNDYRIIWQYLLDNCTIAGIWKKGFRALNYFCNTDISEQEFKEVFGTRAIDRGTFFFIPKFLKYQYPNGLTSDKPMIISVMKEISLNNLQSIIVESLGNDYLIIKERVMVKDTGKKEMVKEEKEVSEKIEKEPDPEIETFVVFWDAYDKKVGKEKTFREWRKLSETDRQAAMGYIPRYKLSKEKQFRKDPERFLKHKVWNDEIITENGTTYSNNGNNKKSGNTDLAGANFSRANTPL